MPYSYVLRDSRGSYINQREHAYSQQSPTPFPSPSPSITYSLILSLTYSFTHSLLPSFLHSLIHMQFQVEFAVDSRETQLMALVMEGAANIPSEQRGREWEVGTAANAEVELQYLREWVAQNDFILPKVCQCVV